MTRKHFEAIANVIAAEVRGADHAQKFTLRMVASGLAAEFAQVNPNFDRERFMVACGVR